LQYQYDSSKEPVNFGLQFVGNHIRYSTDGDYSQGSQITPSYEDFWLSDIDWNDIKVNMFMTGDRDDDVEFNAFTKSPERIRHLFIIVLLAVLLRNMEMLGLEHQQIMIVWKKLAIAKND
jgi:hypothetical protein